MKRIFFLVLITGVFFQGFAQSNASDNNVPPPLPPPVDTNCKKIPQKLISFTMPCCIDGDVNVRDVAKYTFDNPSCPIPCGSIVFNPAVLSPVGASGNATQVVTATACGTTLSANVQVVNSNIVLSVTPLSINFAEVGNKLKNALTAIFNGGVSPCRPSGSLIPTGTINVETSNICCPDQNPCVKRSFKYSCSLTWNYGMTCHFPIFGCPYVASLDAVLSANASASISASYQTTCTAGKFCVNGNGTLSLGGGVGATLGYGFISADLQLVVSGGLSVQYCFSPPPPAGTATVNVGQVQVVGTVSALWGLRTYSVAYTVYDGWTSPPFNF